MEIEKPFKCPVCNAQFTNEDHLAVHRKRHEMSLNLKSDGGQPLSSSLDSFVDETPTPTRFFRNCEEVGLFQDLQHVNPFDEQFAKAANTSSTSSTAGTPSVHMIEPFDFSIALQTSTILPSATTPTLGGCLSEATSTSLGKRRYCDQDTLNTPQIFGFAMGNTCCGSSFSSTTTTTTVLNPMPASSASSSLDISPDPVVTPNNKPKNSLKLKLSTVPVEPKDNELLARNRAAALRSRQRRKQWLSTLETRCGTLEKLLSKTKDDLLREQTDNQTLRKELLKHTECDVTRKERALGIDSLQEVAVGNGNQVVAPAEPPLEPIVTPAKTPSKRGRPRKSEERRAPGIFFPFLANQGKTPSTVPKLPIYSNSSTTPDE